MAVVRKAREKIDTLILNFPGSG